MIDRSAFPRIEGLVDLACRDGVDVRPTLLRVLTDLYIQTYSHSAAEEAQYVELALRLMENVDAPTLTAIATRLAGYPRAPKIIVDRLRQILGTEIVPAAPAPKPPVQEPDIGDAFFAANSYERQLMLANLDAGEPPRMQRSPGAAAETCRRLEAAVLEHRPAEVIHLLERALVLPRAIAEKIIADPSGEPIVVAAKALGMTNTALQRILLLLNPAIGQSVARVYELAALYDEISTPTAESMLAVWRGAARRRSHQTVLYDDEARSARAATTSTRYQTSRRSDALAARFRSTGR